MKRLHWLFCGVLSACLLHTSVALAWQLRGGGGARTFVLPHTGGHPAPHPMPQPQPHPQPGPHPYPQPAPNRIPTRHHGPCHLRHGPCLRHHHRTTGITRGQPPPWWVQPRPRQ